mmetsp:Transcript_17377/g.34898  ORF Transcript_17377/g.34898 Transcript_17377/m.34898 type:complete len:215 (+) Transcript_17377:523-1167(+)
MHSPPPCVFTQSPILPSHLFLFLTKSRLLRLMTYMMGLVVMRANFSLMISTSTFVNSPVLTALLAVSSARTFSRAVAKFSGKVTSAERPRPLAFLMALRSSSSVFVSDARSLRHSSDWMVSRSRMGSTESSTCTISSLSKALRTWKMPSTAAMCERKALPRPAPSAAPLMMPAMSQTERQAGTTDGGFHRSTRYWKRWSGTGHFASLGSMVQKG